MVKEREMEKERERDRKRERWRKREREEDVCPQTKLSRVQPPQRA